MSIVRPAETTTARDVSDSRGRGNIPLVIPSVAEEWSGWGSRDIDGRARGRVSGKRTSQSLTIEWLVSGERTGSSYTYVNVDRMNGLANVVIGKNQRCDARFPKSHTRFPTGNAVHPPASVARRVPGFTRHDRRCSVRCLSGKQYAIALGQRTVAGGPVPSVPEVTDAGENHRHIAVVCGGDHFLIAN